MLRLRFGSILLFITFAAVVCAHSISYADRKEKPARFESLKATYQTLRNTDPGITKENQWRKLADEFEALALDDPKAGDAVSALYHAALLEQEIFTVLGDGKAGSKAASLYDTLATDYPAHGLADDSLLRLGQILYAKEETDKAEEAFARLRKLYPASELNAVAAAVLEGASSEEQEVEEPSPSAAYAGNRPIIVIDPGHGGEDFGALGQGGLLEKDVALAVSFEVAGLLRKLGAIVRLTREKDVFVPLAERTAFANDSSADVFVSLHANASDAKNAGRFSGVESYILDNSKDQSSKLLAERENASVQFEGGGSDLHFMLSDLMQSSKLAESKALAQELQSAVVKSIEMTYGKVNDLGVKKAPFYVLVGAHMPSALVEISFIDNPVEGKNLAEKRYRRAVALGIVDGIQRYLKAHRGKR